MKDKTSVVKSIGGIANNKGKAIMREDKGKESVSTAMVKDIGRGIVLSSLSLKRQKGKGKQGEGGTFSELYASKCSKSSSRASVLDTNDSSHISSSLEDLKMREG